MGLGLVCAATVSVAFQEHSNGCLASPLYVRSHGGDVSLDDEFVRPCFKAISGSLQNVLLTSRGSACCVAFFFYHLQIGVYLCTYVQWYAYSSSLRASASSCLNFNESRAVVCLFVVFSALVGRRSKYLSMYVKHTNNTVAVFFLSNLHII